MKRFSLLIVALGFALTSVYAADEVKLDGVKCIVAKNNAAKADKSRDYKDGKVYFCCDNCKGKVEKAKDDEKLELVFSDKAFEKAGFKVEKK